jgi:hypothetical protein
MEEHRYKVADSVRGPGLSLGKSKTEVAATLKAAQESTRHSPQ